MEEDAPPTTVPPPPPFPNEKVQALEAALRKNMAVVISNKTHWIDDNRRRSFGNKFRRRFMDTFIRRTSLK